MSTIGLLLLLLLLSCSGEGDAPQPVEPAPTPAPIPSAFQPDTPLAAAIDKVPIEWRDRVSPSAGDQALATGARIYGTDCAVCHGVNGDGDGPAARALPQPPSDFTDAGRWAASTVGAKVWLTLKGIPGTSMAPRKDLVESQAWDILFYIENNFQ